MKKIAFVATAYIKNYDGISVYTENLLSASITSYILFLKYVFPMQEKPINSIYMFLFSIN